MFRPRARYFPAKESTQSSPGLRPRRTFPDLFGAGKDLDVRSYPRPLPLRSEKSAPALVAKATRLCSREARPACNGVPEGETTPRPQK